MSLNAILGILLVLSLFVLVYVVYLDRQDAKLRSTNKLRAKRS
jgi:hypothetical protein